jgi:hypothetical protein
MFGSIIDTNIDEVQDAVKQASTKVNALQALAPEQPGPRTPPRFRKRWLGPDRGQ